MSRFTFSSTALDVPQLQATLADPTCGGYAAFEGWVRDHNEGQSVTHLEYEAFEALAIREGERIIVAATSEVAEYRQWLSGVIAEAERLYRVQSQSLDAAEQAISQSRSRLDSAFERLANLHKSVNENLNADNSVIDTGPKKVISQRTKPALAAPAKKSAPKKSAAKKKPAKRR